MQPARSVPLARTDYARHGAGRPASCRTKGTAGANFLRIWPTPSRNRVPSHCRVVGRTRGRAGRSVRRLQLGSGTVARGTDAWGRMGSRAHLALVADDGAQVQAPAVDA